MIAIVLLFAPLPVFARAAWIRALLDLAHVPIGALLTACIWRVLNGTVWQAVILVAVVTGAAELAQGLVANRTPNAFEFLWGLLGAISVVVCITAFP